MHCLNLQVLLLTANVLLLLLLDFTMQRAIAIACVAAYTHFDCTGRVKKDKWCLCKVGYKCKGTPNARNAGSSNAVNDAAAINAVGTRNAAVVMLVQNAVKAFP